MLSAQASRGFTLVEVMVTVFVVAIGLLAAAGLQTVSKKAAYDALQRSTATVLAQDMLERIRSNSTQVDSYSGTQISSTPTSLLACGGTTQAACSPNELVAYDITQWWNSLDGAAEKIVDGAGTANAGGLRNPAGCIRLTGNQLEVVVTWRGLSSIQQAAATDLADPTSDSCFNSLAAYEQDSSSGQSFRRVLRLQAHIEARS